MNRITWPRVPIGGHGCQAFITFLCVFSYVKTWRQAAAAQCGKSQMQWEFKESVTDFLSFFDCTESKLLAGTFLTFLLRLILNDPESMLTMLSPVSVWEPENCLLMFLWVISGPCPGSVSLDIWCRLHKLRPFYVTIVKQARRHFITAQHAQGCWTPLLNLQSVPECDLLFH